MRVTNCVQTKNGMRIQPMPLARRLTIVAMKLTLERSDDVMLNAIAMIQIDWPVSHRGHLALSQWKKAAPAWLAAKSFGSNWVNQTGRCPAM